MTPAILPPEQGAHVWNAFWAVRRFIKSDDRIKPGDLMDFAKMTGCKIDKALVPTVFDMDAKFVETLQAEIDNNTARRKGG